MKYSSLKRQAVRSFKIPALSGGFATNGQCEKIADNQVTACKNMWFKDGAFKTRPGFKGDKSKAVETEVLGYSGSLNYKVLDGEIYINNTYHKIATADVSTDDYAHYTYVCLIDPEDNIIPIGNMAFLRLASDIFYEPENILFFTGRSKKGGIFALVTLRNQYNYSQKNYYIYEVNADYTEWEKVYDYYIPTISINGRGNRYQTARKESGINLPNPKTLESQNVLTSKFNAYFTSDGYSSSFKLPFSNLSNEQVVCRIYYTFVDYVEWVISADSAMAIKDFYGKKVKAIIDREKGALYFVTDDGSYAIPVMEYNNENNIKITASKEIGNGFSKIVHSTCHAKQNEKLLLSGGMDGNTIYVADYDNPLYFPQNAAVSVGDSQSEIVAMTLLRDKILAFKMGETYLLTLKEGDRLNEVSLLSDNDKIFKESDRITAQMISSKIGCAEKKTVTICGNRCVWLGGDNFIYAVKSATQKEIVKICEYSKGLIYEGDYSCVFGVGNEKYYIFVSDGKMVVCDIEDLSHPKIYLWHEPDGMKIDSGYYYNGEFKFLSAEDSKNAVFVVSLKGDTDTVLYYADDEKLSEKQLPIGSSVTTKCYDLCGFSNFKNIDNIYLSMAAHGKVKVNINGREAAVVNFDSSNDIYGKCNYKTVKLIPHLHKVDTVSLEIATDHQMSIGEIEIFYRVTG